MPRSSANPRAAASTASARGRLKSSDSTWARRAAAAGASYAMVSSESRAAASNANARNSSVATSAARSCRARSRTSVATLTSEYIPALQLGRAARPRDPDRQDDAREGEKSNAYGKQSDIHPSAAAAAAGLRCVLELNQGVVAERRRRRLVDVLPDAERVQVLPPAGGAALIDRAGLLAARCTHLQRRDLVHGLADDLDRAVAGRRGDAVDVGDDRAVGRQRCAGGERRLAHLDRGGSVGCLQRPGRDVENDLRALLATVGVRRGR